MISKHKWIYIVEWWISGISLVSETTEEELSKAEGETPELTTGVKVAYTTPASDKVSQHFALCRLRRDRYMKYMKEMGVVVNLIFERKWACYLSIFF